MSKWNSFYTQCYSGIVDKVLTEGKTIDDKDYQFFYYYRACEYICNQIKNQYKKITGAKSKKYINTLDYLRKSVRKYQPNISVDVFNKVFSENKKIRNKIAHQIPRRKLHTDTISDYNQRIDVMIQLLISLVDNKY